MFKVNHFLLPQKVRFLKPNLLATGYIFNQAQLSFTRNFHPSIYRDESTDQPKRSLSQKTDKSFLSGILGISGTALIGGLGYYLYQLASVDAARDLQLKEALEKRNEKKKLHESIQDFGSISPEKAEIILTENEKTYQFSVSSEENKGKTLKVHTNQVASNNPMEDRYYVSSKIEQNQLILGVFDGHSGFNCSEYISKALPEEVLKQVFPLLAKLPESERNLEAYKQSVENIQNQLKDAFLSVDDLLIYGQMKLKKTLTYEDLAPAVNGSCALLATYDTINQHLFVAVTGDCRAVLGRLNEEGSWFSVPLSVDQTTKNPKEFSRLLKEHPGEERTVIQRNRILGCLQPTRAFGDARFKWEAPLKEEIFEKFFPQKRHFVKHYLTPPYVTARPEVRYHKVDPNYDEFLVLATDGLYDELTSQQVVELVGNHLAKPPTFGTSPLRKRRGSDDVYTFQDSNLATHLIRNALGGAPIEFKGKNNEKIAPLLKVLAIPAPKCRRYRDDITVLVLHFNHQVPDNSTEKQ